MKNALEPHLVTPAKPPAKTPAGTTPSPTQPPSLPNAAIPSNAYAAQCPTRLVLDRITDKWTVLILGLLAEKPIRFNALLRMVEGLSQKVLSQTLKRMERDGLVTRTAYASVPVTVEYAVTPLGTTLAGSLRLVIDWAERNIDAVLSAQQAYDAAKPSNHAVVTIGY